MTRPGQFVPVDPNARLYEALTKVLETVGEVFEGRGVDLPDRRYVSFGPYVVDCEQVVVEFINVYVGPPGQEVTAPQQCHAPRTMVFGVDIWRCIPTAGARGTPPEADVLTESGRRKFIDSWLLFDVACGIDQWGYGIGILANVSALANEGGFGGVRLEVTAQVP